MAFTNQPTLVQAIVSLVPSLTYPQDFEVDTSGVSKWYSEAIQPPVTLIQTTYDALIASQTTTKTQNTNLRNAVLTTAQSAVGVNLTALTANQVRSLLALMLYKAGGVDASGNVKPLTDWV
jgi:hypothetical protein